MTFAETPTENVLLENCRMSGDSAFDLCMIFAIEKQHDSELSTWYISHTDQFDSLVKSEEKS